VCGGTLRGARSRRDRRPRPHSTTLPRGPADAEAAIRCQFSPVYPALPPVFHNFGRVFVTLNSRLIRYTRYYRPYFSGQAPSLVSVAHSPFHITLVHMLFARTFGVTKVQACKKPTRSPIFIRHNRTGFVTIISDGRPEAKNSEKNYVYSGDAPEPTRRPPERAQSGFDDSRPNKSEGSQRSTTTVVYAYRPRFAHDGDAGVRDP
jgi:hypothetical protein